MNELVEALWVFLPAGLANAAPVFANKIPGLNRWQTPLDLGRSYRGRRIFGPNKTWRGVSFAVVVAGLAAWLQSQFDFHPFGPAVAIEVGVLLGFGAIYGDAVESFFKRQYGVPSGHSWFPFDQTDYIIGALLATAPLVLFGWDEIAVIALVYFGLHLGVAYLGYRLNFKDKPI